jgi:hypothetical protein
MNSTSLRAQARLDLADELVQPDRRPGSGSRDG